MAASTPLKNTVFIEEEWIAATKEEKKHCTLTELFSAIKHSNLQEKHAFRNNCFGSQPFLLSCYYTKTFVHLSVIVAIFYFSVYKLIVWDPVNILVQIDQQKY